MFGKPRNLPSGRGNPIPPSGRLRNGCRRPGGPKPKSRQVNNMPDNSFQTYDTS